METVLITGGTGLVGRALTKQLIKKGYRVIILTRKLPAGNTQANPRYALWNVNEKTIDSKAVQQADHIIHLAGAGVVDKRWSKAYKKEIQDSRTQSSALLIQAMQQHENKIKIIVSASAIGWYGEDGEAQQKGQGFTESSSAAPGFLGDICHQWEQSIEPGIVLSNDGGALAEFKKPLQFGIAGILSKGTQIVSWIHIDDLCRMFVEAIQNEQLSGAYNAVAPAPVSNKTLTLELASIVKGKSFIPIHVPAIVLKIMLGESSVEVLKSCTVSCEKIKQAGFTFLYPSIEAALNQLCNK
jgi:uncharacterized protein